MHFLKRSDMATQVFGRPFVKRFALYHTVVCPVCVSETLNGWMDQDANW